MPHTPLLGAIVRVAGRVANGHEFRPTRRGFLMTAGAASMAKGAPVGRVAVVGAGLAGLTCAWRLRQKGVAADVFEASDRLGGRCWSQRSGFAEGQMIERGGELIDQGHKEIRQLCQELGLRLDNLLAAEAKGTEPFYYFDGGAYTYEDATRDLKGIWQKLHKDVSAAGYPTTYYQSTERGRELDAMSIVDWIEETVPQGMNSRLGQLLAVAYNIEYGAEAEEQSALNLLYLLGYIGPGRLRLFGPSNEKYHVRGGNDQIVTQLGARLAGQIRTGHRLTKLTLQAGGGFELTFATAGGPVTVAADRVVMAIPFSILRSSVDVSAAGFRPLKLTAIEQLGMGANTKFHLQFTNRLWRAQGGNGDSFSDTGYQASWEVTRAQAGTAGILVNYTGGDAAVAAIGDTPASVLGRMEPVFPGLSGVFNGLWQREYWPGNPLTLGSYSFWKPGQYTLFGGVEGEREGNCHFCGEHTSQDFQGYLNGAVETGERAAAEVLG